jgi:hypothetical protein
MDDKPSTNSTVEDSQPLMRTDSNMKVSREQWAVIRSLAEAGKPYDTIAKDYPITSATIRGRSTNERWVTPKRLVKAAKGKLAADDPATAVAHLWKERGTKSREKTFTGASKALERFFALSPVPDNFQEAAVAAKLMNEAISPPSESDNSTQVNLAILTAQNFEPSLSPVVDVDTST